MTCNSSSGEKRLVSRFRLSYNVPLLHLSSCAGNDLSNTTAAREKTPSCCPSSPCDTPLHLCLVYHVLATIPVKIQQQGRSVWCLSSLATISAKLQPRKETGWCLISSACDNSMPPHQSFITCWQRSETSAAGRSDYCLSSACDTTLHLCVVRSSSVGNDLKLQQREQNRPLSKFRMGHAAGVHLCISHSSHGGNERKPAAVSFQPLIHRSTSASFDYHVLETI